MTTTQTRRPEEVRPAANPRLVVWVELPQPGESQPVSDPSRGVYDPAALYEECERWDGMA